MGFWYGGRHPGEIWNYSNYLQSSGSDRSGRTGLGAHLRQRVLGAVGTLLSVLELVGELFVLLQVDVGDFFLKTHHLPLFSHSFIHTASSICFFWTLSLFWSLSIRSCRRSKFFLSSSTCNHLQLLLRVNVSKNQSLSKGGVSRGPSIWLIFTYIVQFFTLILVVLSIFHKNDRMQDYGSFKF